MFPVRLCAEKYFFNTLRTIKSFYLVTFNLISNVVPTYFPVANTGVHTLVPGTKESTVFIQTSPISGIGAYIP